jgi:hypothetical protein
MPAKAEIRYSEIVGAASVSVTIPIFSHMILTKTGFVVVFGDILRGHPLESDNLRAFAGRDMHLLSSKNLQKPVVSIISVWSWTWGDFCDANHIGMVVDMGGVCLEGITHQPPKPPSRPRLPHQNFLDFSKTLENSIKKNPDYREYSKYCEYRINFSNLWRYGLQNPS